MCRDNRFYVSIQKKNFDFNVFISAVLIFKQEVINNFISKETNHAVDNFHNSFSALAGGGSRFLYRGWIYTCSVNCSGMCIDYPTYNRQKNSLIKNL